MTAASSFLPPLPPDAGFLEALCREGWCVAMDLFPRSLLSALHEEARARFEQQQFRRAGIGRPGAVTVMPAQRGDWIQWLEGTTAAQRDYFAAVGQLRGELETALRVGLGSFEAHYSCYPPGADYPRHWDNARGRNRRLISIVTYLNPHWPDGAGGELELFADGEAREPAARVLPAMGSSVLFLAQQIPHRVLAASRSRWALTGWLSAREPVFAV